MFPTPDHNTNNSFRLGHTNTGDSVWMHVNESHRWWFRSGQLIADYSGTWTLVEVHINTISGIVDISLDGVEVVTNAVVNLPQGINRVGMHSGRGGAGHTSYFDELIITTAD
jgi:hypothetical protein